MFEPLTTTGVPLAIRDDWQAVLRAAAAPSPRHAGASSAPARRE